MEGQQLDSFNNESLEFYAKVREQHHISITSVTKEIAEGLVIYTAVGTMPIDGSSSVRQDSASGAVSIEGLTGLAKADAFKSAETSAKSRLTISLTGIRMERQQVKETLRYPEPDAPEAPQVNNAPAEVVDEQKGALALPLSVTVEGAQAIAKKILEEPKGGFLLPNGQILPAAASVAEIAAAMTVPPVTEQQLTSIHKEAESLEKQHVPTQEQTHGDPGPQAPPPYLDAPQAGIFDEGPEIITAPQAPPAPESKAEVVDAVLAAVQPATATGVTMPVPVAKPADQPTRLQFQGYTTRCTKIVRDLQKAGKDAPPLFMPYLRKVFNTKELSPETTSITLWESTLSAIENAGSPAAALKILKGN